MEEKNNWEEISGDISNVAKKFKSKIDEENLVEDLKDSLKNTIENTTDVVNALIKTINSTVKDDEIKEDTVSIIKNISQEFKLVVDETKSKITGVLEEE